MISEELMYLNDIKLSTKMIAISFWCMFYEN